MAPLSVVKRDRLLNLLNILLFLRVVGSAVALTPTISQSRDRMIPSLPDRLLIGYATECNDEVAAAIRQGINVIVWSFLEIHSQTRTFEVRVEFNSLDLDGIRRLKEDLIQEGYEDTLHLVSFGGWNGPHLDTNLDADSWFDAWKQATGGVFHGIDFDLEGHDDRQSPTNEFSVECLEKMGHISQLAKQEGYVIGIAPPQSYLDIDSPKFSRSVILSEPDRPWHAEFQYFGANVYGYLLAKYEPYIDFISIQFYESYSRAAMEVQNYNVGPANYLESYINKLVSQNESFMINFDADPSTKLTSQHVKLPISKLVWGFANGWALDTGDKAIFFEPEEIRNAYESVLKEGHAPRGFMFWVLGEEGTNGKHYVKSLSDILRAQPSIETVKRQEL